MKKKMHAICMVMMVCCVLAGNALEAIKSDDPLRDSTRLANRRTALRCLGTASTYAAEKKWPSAISQARLGLSYDDSISDLWYLYAVAEAEIGRTKAEILPHVQKALHDDNWVNYNRDNARILYADILADTTRSEEVFAVLDAAPFIYSSDAEYIRAKAYYRMGDAQSLVNARNKIASARKIYPGDTRFPLLFFLYESPDDESAEVRRMADYFISQISQYAEAAPDKDAELEILAASFARGDTRVHLLKSFSARNLRHPLYARVALDAGLLDQRDAFAYIASFADERINYTYLANFMPLLSDESVLQLAKEYFTAYDGMITADTNNDGVEDLFVQYYRGRPETVDYDGNQDGRNDWHVVCDFGVPVTGSLENPHLLSAASIDFSWFNYPYLKTVTLKNEARETLSTFDLVAEELQWSPLSIVQEPVISSLTGIQFFFPIVAEQLSVITEDALLAAASSFTIPTAERKNAFIRVISLNGMMQVADYYVDGKIYAQAQFEDNVPTFRLLDADDDGVFETTEFYALDQTGEMDEAYLADARLILPVTFMQIIDRTLIRSEEGAVVESTVRGDAVQLPRYYLRMVQVDRNADTVPDFTEEYLVRGGRITSWDTNDDNEWDVRSVIYPRGENGDVVEDALFYDSGHTVVTVRTVNGVPTTVTSGEQSLTVSRDVAFSKFYWLGDIGSATLAKKAVTALAGTQGLSMVVEDEGVRVLCVHVGEFSYGKIIPQEHLSDGSVLEAE